MGLRYALERSAGCMPWCAIIHHVSIKIKVARVCLQACGLSWQHADAALPPP